MNNTDSVLSGCVTRILFYHEVFATLCWNGERILAKDLIFAVPLGGTEASSREKGKVAQRQKQEKRPGRTKVIVLLRPDATTDPSEVAAQTLCSTASNTVYL